MNLVKNVALTVLGVGIFLFMILLYNLIDPSGVVPSLKEGYWGGYYETKSLGKVWCLAKFYKEGTELRVVILSAADTSDIFIVDRSTSDPQFIHLVMKARDFEEKIEAKQLYVGKRYIWGRLFAGRFRDFWKQNEDDAIRGRIASTRNFFGLERRLEGEDLIRFYNDVVLSEQKYATLDEIDAVIEEAKHRPPVTNEEIRKRVLELLSDWKTDSTHAHITSRKEAPNKEISRALRQC